MMHYLFCCLRDGRSVNWRYALATTPFAHVQLWWMRRQVRLGKRIRAPVVPR